MLNTKDIALLREMFQGQENRLDQKLHDQFGVQESRFDKKIAEQFGVQESRFDQKLDDLKVNLRDEIHSTVKASEAGLIRRMDAMEERLVQRMDSGFESMNELIDDGVLPQMNDIDRRVIHLETLPTH